MPLRSTDTRWGGAAQAFHWVMALLIIAQGTIGLSMVELATTPTKVKVYALHKSIGLTVLALVLLRLLWRAVDRRPIDPSTMPRWQHLAARATHLLLYLLMLALPLSGWLFNSASNFALSWFGLVHLPSLTGGFDPVVKTVALGVHVTLFWILVAALIIHIAAALWHQFRQKDEVLLRMLPGTKRRTSLRIGE